MVEEAAGHKWHITPPHGGPSSPERAPVCVSLGQNAGKSHPQAQSAEGQGEILVEPDHWVSLEPGQWHRDHFHQPAVYSQLTCIEVRQSEKSCHRAQPGCCCCSYPARAESSRLWCTSSQPTSCPKQLSNWSGGLCWRKYIL